MLLVKLVKEDAQTLTVTKCSVPWVMYISVCYILLCVALHQRGSWLGGTLHQRVVHLWLDGIWMCLLYRTNNDVNIIWLYPSPFLIFPSCTSTQDQRSRALSPKFHCSIWAWLLLSANQAPFLCHHHILRTSCLCILSASFHPAEHQVTIFKSYSIISLGTKMKSISSQQLWAIVWFFQFACSTETNE